MEGFSHNSHSVECREKAFHLCKTILCFTFSRECPTSTSMEEEAIQGMLSMAGLHYANCLPGHMSSTVCTDRSSLQEHRSYPQSRHKDKLFSQSLRVEYGRCPLAATYCTKIKRCLNLTFFKVAELDKHNRPI